MAHLLLILVFVNHIDVKLNTLTSIGKKCQFLAQVPLVIQDESILDFQKHFDMIPSIEEENRYLIQIKLFKFLNPRLTFVLLSKYQLLLVYTKPTVYYVIVYVVGVFFFFFFSS